MSGQSASMTRKEATKVQAAVDCSPKKTTKTVSGDAEMCKKGMSK